MTGQSRGRQAAQQRASREVATRDNGGAVAQQGGADSVRALFQQMQPEIQRALPKHMDPDRMIRVALTVVGQNPELQRCDARSLLGALMTCAQVGLEPGPQGHVYFVPYARKVTFIMGYQGMIELARRSGLLLSIAAHTIYANEVKENRFTVEYGTTNRLEHRPIVFGDRGDAVGYYATARIKSPASDATEDVFVVLTRAEVDAFRARSATQKPDRPSGPWSTDYEAMAWKTCIRRLARWLPQSPELAAALEHEERVREDVRGNVTEQAQPAPAEPFDPSAAGMGVLPAPIEDPSAVPAGDPEQDGPPAGSQAAEPDGEPENDPWGDDPEPPDPHDGRDPWAEPEGRS